MFDDFGNRVLKVDVLGTVRDAAGFDTGLRVRHNVLDSPQLTLSDGSYTGLSLRNDRVFDRWNQPLNATIEPFEPLIRPIEPAFKPRDFGLKTRW